MISGDESIVSESSSKLTSDERPSTQRYPSLLLRNRIIDAMLQPLLCLLNTYSAPCLDIRIFDNF